MSLTRLCEERSDEAISGTTTNDDREVQLPQTMKELGIRETTTEKFNYLRARMKLNFKTGDDEGIASPPSAARKDKTIRSSNIPGVPDFEKNAPNEVKLRTNMI